MFFRYKSLMGEFRIHEIDENYWQLCLAGYRIGRFNSPEEAVGAISGHKTGFRPWDVLVHHTVPPVNQWLKDECFCEGQGSCAPFLCHDQKTSLAS